MQNSIETQEYLDTILPVRMIQNLFTDLECKTFLHIYPSVIQNIFEFDNYLQTHYCENSRLFIRDFGLRGLFKERIYRVKR